MGRQLQRLDLDGLLFASIPILMFAVPTIYLHLNYYIKNIGLEMAIDDIGEQISFVKNGNEHVFKISNIKCVEQHLGIYYRNRIDFAGRRIAPWTPYGYFLLKFDNGNQFYVTCLMVDVTSPPFDITHTYFRFFPYLRKGFNLLEKRKVANEDYENQISFYKSNFKLHSQEELKEKIVNEKTYEKAAVEAARQLLKSKFETTI